MLVSPRRIALLLFLMVLLPIGARREADPAGAILTNRLQAEVARLAAADPAAELKVWVKFAPRELWGPALAAALDRAEEDMTPRAARRRAKMHGPGERLVDIRDLPLDAKRLADCAVTGARLHQQSRWLNAASFRATAAQIQRLARVPGVRELALVNGLRRAAVPTPVDEVVPVARRDRRPATKTTLDYGGNLAAMVQANVPAAHDMGLTGNGVVVGLLDTGFRTAHEALAGLQVLGAWDFVNNDGVVDNEGADPASARNHGTMTLSTVAGNMPGQLVAPAFGVSVLLGKTEDVAVEVPLEEDNWVAGLEWAEALGADIISSSLGYLDWYVAADLDGNTAVTTIAADLAAGRGLVVVNSAGNEGATSGLLIAPADADSIITVGAVDDLDVTAWFSSPGPTADGRIKPDVAARGVQNTVASPLDDAGYAQASGTSFSCPLTSGVVALILERVPGLTPLQVREALRATASQSTAPDTSQGWGIIDAAAAATWFGPVISHTPLDTVSGPNGPFAVKATITDRVGLGTAALHFSVSGGPWQNTPLLPDGAPDEFAAEIPAVFDTARIDYYLTAASSNGIATAYPYAGAADAFSFFVNPASPVADDRLPAVTQLLPNVPNPFNPQTEISFRLPRSDRVQLAIYDLRGQLVRTLLDAQLPPGRHTATWDGRDRAGLSVSSGTYLYQLRGAGIVQQRKMQLVR